MKEKTKSFFQTVTKSGGLFNSDHLSLKATKGGSSKSEVHVVVSKKVVPSAVSRNRIRRRVRGLFEEINPSSMQAVFYTKKGAKDISLNKLREEVGSLISDVEREK
ncbi:ribonuclease P protein component [candidate division KSB1 bacterium]